MSVRDEATVTLSQIAELAGVGPSAVSNWRKRFPDFPQPVTTAAAGRDLFPLAAIEEWLTRHDRVNADRASERLVFDALNVIRGRMTVDEGVQAFAAAIALAAVLPAIHRGDVPGARARIGLVERQRPDLRGAFGPLDELDPEMASRLMTIADAIDPDDRTEIFEAILRQRSRFVETRTSEELALLLAALVGAPRDVFDPTAGEGTILAAIGDRSKNTRLFGQEINEAAWRIAVQRFLLRGVEGELRIGDSLLDDGFPGLRVDAVVCDPPFNMKNPLLDRDSHLAWVSFAASRVRTTDLLWLEHALAHVRPDGRAYVLLPAGSLFRGGRERDVRIELLRRGAVHAIVSLPAGSAQHTSVQLALWVLQGDGSSTSVVLMVDATESKAGPRRGISEESIPHIAAVLERWHRESVVEPDDAAIAAAVPVVELLANDADLTPSRWVQVAAAAPAEDRARNAAEALDRFTELRAQLAGRNNATIAAPDDTLNVQWVSVRELAGTDVAEVVRGVRFRQEDCLDEGVRVLRTRDIRDTVQNDKPCYANADDPKLRPTLTQPGDIVLSPASGRLSAVVDEEGGHILATPLQALRFREDWMDPYVAAAFLESPRNRRFAKGTNWGYARVDLRDLELPVLPPQEAQQFRATLDELAMTERNARELAAQARAARESILDAVSDAGDQPWR